MKKLTIILVLVILGVIGNVFLPDSTTSVSTIPSVNAEETVELTEAEKQEKHNEWYRQQRFNECYGAMTIAHKKNGLQERDRALAIKTRETTCTAALTDETITAWNKKYTEVK